VFTVQQVVNYFTQRGSTVFMAALDASKAFDRVCHFKLFNKLVDRNVPVCLVEVLCNWYDKLYASVRWNGAISHVFPVKCGVRQGGVLSFWLFNVDVDDLIIQLESSNAGCHVRCKFFGCIMYTSVVGFCLRSSEYVKYLLQLWY